MGRGGRLLARQITNAAFAKPANRRRGYVLTSRTRTTHGLSTLTIIILFVLFWQLAVLAAICYGAFLLLAWIYKTTVRPAKPPTAPPEWQPAVQAPKAETWKPVNSGSEYCPRCDTVLYRRDACACGWHRAPGEQGETQPRTSDVLPEGAESPGKAPLEVRSFEKGRKHVASDGTLVRSKSEMIIANLLHAKDLPYEYEAALTRGSETRRPDFTIRTPTRTYYWEHLGMLGDAAYAQKWAKKEAWYKANGITPTSNETRLVLTRDGPDGSFDSAEAAKVVEALV